MVITINAKKKYIKTLYSVPPLLGLIHIQDITLFRSIFATKKVDSNTQFFLSLICSKRFTLRKENLFKKKTCKRVFLFNFIITLRDSGSG